MTRNSYCEKDVISARLVNVFVRWFASNYATFIVRINEKGRRNWRLSFIFMLIFLF